MAKIAALNTSKVIPLEVDGVYIKDLPIAQVEALFKNADQRLAEEDQTFVLDIFNNLICDENGEQFEDLIDADFETLSQLLTMSFLWDIVSAIPKALSPGGVELGK